MRKKVLFLAAMTAAVGANAQEKILVDGYEAVDLGLSVNWATRNIGAEYIEEAGSFFRWGETVPYLGSDTHEDYSFLENPKQLPAENDAATQIMGENWRMPTEAEFTELFQNCHWEWTNKYEGWCPGMIFYKKKADENYDVNSDVHIFLPSAGVMHGNNIYSQYGGENGTGCYWSSSLSFVDSDYAYYLDIRNNNPSLATYWKKDSSGMTIRAVCAKPEASKLNFVEKENETKVYKTFENGQIVIVKNGVKYNLAGKKL